jgi:hypothetical protein
LSERVPVRSKVGIAPKISDPELLTLAVMQALLGFTSETRWLRFARAHLVGMFPALPGQSGYNKRLRKLAGTMSWLITQLAAQTSIAWSIPPRSSVAGPGREEPVKDSV